MVVEGPTSWKELVFQHWDLLDKLARRRFPDQNMADEALLFVERGLSADDYKRVKAYAGKVEFSRFLSHVTYRLLEDFARHKFGRVRPPAWVKRLDSVWEELFKLLCMERLSVMGAVETMLTNAPEGRDRRSVESAASDIVERIQDCGKRTPQPVSLDGEYMEGKVSQDLESNHSLPPDQSLAQDQKQAALGAFSVILGAAMPEGGQGDTALEPLYTALAENVDMDDQDCLFLGLIYQDGMNVSAAGRTLGLRADQAHTRLQKLLGRIRKALAESGCLEALEDMFS